MSHLGRGRDTAVNRFTYLTRSSLAICTVALEILRRNTNGAIKFKGMMVGNPYVDPFSNMEAEINASYFHGLLPENQYQSWLKHCSTPQTYQNVVRLLLLLFVCLVFAFAVWWALISRSHAILLSFRLFSVLHESLL